MPRPGKRIIAAAFAAACVLAAGAASAGVVVAASGPSAGNFPVGKKIGNSERIVLRASSGLSASHPAQEKMKAASGPAAFVCVGERCSLPVTSASGLTDAVRAMR